jgi:hypothetical protein
VEDGALRSYDGGWADLVRQREEAASPPAERDPAPPKKAKASRPAAQRRGPSELDRVEARVDELERHVAALEVKLAEDWSDMDVLAAHRAARDELQAQLARWEELFAAVQDGRAASEPGT